MKKITFYFLMLLSFSAFAQIEVNQNFDDTANNQVPAGWTETNFAASSNFPCDGSVKAVNTAFTSAGVETLTTPNYTAISNGTDLTVSFSYNILEQVSQFPPPSFVAPAAAWGSIVLEYSTDGVNWTNITTIDDSNFTYVNTSTCSATANVTVSGIANASDFQARFVVTAANISNFALWVVLDNVSFNQVATTAPNCDAVLTNPLSGSSTADLDTTLSWSSATGIPTDYIVSVGTTTGGTDVVNAASTAGATSYDLSSEGLVYDTQYFVTITPTNGIGSATGCVEESFTTRSAPIAGATCGSPIVISSFPYVEAGGDTDLYEDNIDTSPCNNTYMNGKDVFYEITPTTDVSINIDMANMSNNGSSIHVLNGCPDVATECVAYVGSFSGATRSLTEVVLLAGNTYFMVLSNSGSTRTYTYDLIITQNDCINPSMTFAPVSDCGNSQFTVDVDVTYLGDATSLTLTDDFSNTYSNITATGIVSAGPYPSGSTVNFTLTNDQDGSCSFGDSTFFFCPTSNDECATATVLTANTDDTCTIIINASNAGATESTGFTSTCSGGDTNDVWFSFVATAENMFVEYSNKVLQAGSGNILKSELFSGSCGTLTSLACYNSDYVAMEGLMTGNTYYLRNYSNSTGAMISFDLCLSNYPTVPVNDACIDAIPLTLSADSSCGSATASSLAGSFNSPEGGCTFGDVWFSYTPAADGVFEIVGTGVGRMVIYEGTCAAGLTPLATAGNSNTCNSNITNARYMALTGGETYFIMARKFSDTSLGADITVCIYELAAPANNDCSDAIVIAESDDMGSNMVSGDLTASLYSPELAACTTSTSYEAIWYSYTASVTGQHNFVFNDIGSSVRYAVYDTGDCASMATASLLPGQENCTSNDENFSAELTNGETYLISVFAFSATNTDFELFIYRDPSLGVVTSDFDQFRFYPNPVENILNIEANNSISNVSVYNMIGQKVKELAPNELNATLDMNELNQGVYFVSVTINDAQQTFKVIKK
ncbi:T9SS type A sorting domain-containing protein [uncultured Winogradskyella sp.]|uniref:T9SS type A sorting domain-containing protein n=1 Tax=uncultured Winogradskyella sp. TaxID=395353 RepID=UPI0030D98C9C|tara:strand:+ start:233343 stop:236345 length:3003 start_codon:yes stop_codon:yes gene_type:complete